MAEKVSEINPQVSRLLAEVAALDKRNLTPPQFFGEFLPRVVSAVGAEGGAVWVTPKSEQVQCYCHVAIERAALDNNPQQHQWLSQALNQAVDAGKPLIVPANSEAEDNVGNAADVHFLFLPLKVEDKFSMVLHIFLPAQLDRDAFRGRVAVIQQFTTHAETFLAQRRTALIDAQRKTADDLLSFAAKVHDSLDPTQVCHHAANVGRDTLGAERCTVYINPPGIRKRRAISGVDSPQKKAVVVKTLDNLAEHVRRNNSTLVVSRQQFLEMDDTHELRHMLAEYFDASNLDWVCAAPIPSSKDDEDALGAILFEHVDESIQDAEATLSGMVPHVGTAVENAIEIATLPGIRVLRAARKLKQFMLSIKGIILVLAIAALIAAMVYVPMNFSIEADFVLRPVNASNVVARVEGVVNDVLVEYGDVIEAGTVVAQIKDSRLQTVLASERAGLEKAKIQKDMAIDEASETGSRAAVGLAESEILSARQKILLLEAEIEDCKIRSVRGGTIVTEKLQQRVGSFMERGDVFCQLADVTQLELAIQVPEAEVGFIQAELVRQQPNSLEVVFLTKGHQERQYTRIPDVDAVAPSASEYEEEPVFIVTTDPLDLPAELQQRGVLKPGTTGRAKIKLDRKPLGFVIFRKFVRFIQMHLML